MDNTNAEDIYKWIDNHPITRPKKCIHRDFSDAVPLAEILKNYYPKLVDLHNYSPKNAVNLKLINWQILNKKVLSKINYTLDKNVMDKLAQAVPGVIEKILFDLKIILDEKEGKKKEKENEILVLNGYDSADAVTEIKVKTGSKIFTQKMVPNEIFERMQRNLVEQDDSIMALRNKVNHLEALVSIKEERIRDLTQQLQKYNIVNSPKTKNARFFRTEGEY